MTERLHKPTVCLLGSPRRNGNSDALAMQFTDRAKQYGVPVETFALSQMNYSGCKNLFRCKQDLDRCGQSDDLTVVLEAVSNAQVLVLATPVYFTSISGQLKLAIDRFFSFFVPDYPTAKQKSRLTGDRHLVFLQTQGEPADRYVGLLDSFAVSFTNLGFEHHHLVRATGVRNPDDVKSKQGIVEECDQVAARIYNRQ